MRRLIESLSPADPRIYWNWVGTVFALYVVVMAAAIGMFANHQSVKGLAQQAATAGQQRSPVEAAVSVRHVAKSE